MREFLVGQRLKMVNFHTWLICLFITMENSITFVVGHWFIRIGLLLLDIVLIMLENCEYFFWRLMLYWVGSVKIFIENLKFFGTNLKKCKKIKNQQKTYKIINFAINLIQKLRSECNTGCDGHHKWSLYMVRLNT